MITTERNTRPIKNWDIAERPRERLFEKKAKALSDAELLSILIGPGNARVNAVDLARNVLSVCQNSLPELGRCNVHDLMKVKGIGKTKAAIIVAAMELSRRKDTQAAITYPILKDSQDAHAYIRPLIKDYQHEVFIVLFLAQSGRLRHSEIVSEGGITSTTVDPRLIMKKALDHRAISIIAGHNHPSGSTRPSKADEALTQKILQGGKTLDIKLLDHIIVGAEGYFSFADEGLLA